MGGASLETFSGGGHLKKSPCTYLQSKKHFTDDSRSSRHFADYSDTFQLTWTLFRSPGSSTHFSSHQTLLGSSRHFSHCTDTFQIIETYFGSSGHFSDHPNCQDTFHIIKTLSGSSGHFLDQPETFHIMWTLLRSSGNFFDRLDTFHIIQTYFLPSGHYTFTPGLTRHFPYQQNTFRIIRRLFRSD